MTERDERPDPQRVVRAERLKSREPASVAVTPPGRILFPAGYPESMRRAARGELALADYFSACKERPQEIATLAAAFYAADRLEEARVLFEGLCGIAGGDARYHNALGAVLLRQKRSGEALAALDRALKLDEANLEAWVNRAEAHLLRGQYQEAAADMRRAIALDPGKTSPAANRARQMAWGMHQLCVAAGNA
jgi:tetratricopeptide (TPR) repeat protein